MGQESLCRWSYKDDIYTFYGLIFLNDEELIFPLVTTLLDGHKRMRHRLDLTHLKRPWSERRTFKSTENGCRSNLRGRMGVWYPWKLFEWQCYILGCTSLSLTQLFAKGSELFYSWIKKSKVLLYFAYTFLCEDIGGQAVISEI